MLFVSFVVGVPWMLYRDWRYKQGIGPTTALFVSLGLAYWALSGMYALLHVEHRYLMGFAPIPVLIGGYILQILFQTRKKSVLRLSFSGASK